VGNPRVAVPCCVTSCALLIFTAYSASLSIDYSRYERFTPTTCLLSEWELRQRDCTLTVCTSPSPSNQQVCTTVQTTCTTCWFVATAETVDGHVIQAYTDFEGDFTTVARAENGCAEMQASSPVKCWYQPQQPRGNRFYISLAAPTVGTSAIPVVLFGAIFVVSAVALLYCECSTAQPGEGFGRALQLARSRAWDRESRAARWQDYYAFNADDDLSMMTTNASATAAVAASSTSASSSSSNSGSSSSAFSNPMHRSGAAAHGGLTHRRTGGTSSSAYDDLDGDIEMTNPMRLSTSLPPAPPPPPSAAASGLPLPPPPPPPPMPLSVPLPLPPPPPVAVLASATVGDVATLEAKENDTPA
jgi:hypothetical protein